MTEPEVGAADTIFQRRKIRFVVIGGQAIARQAATATRDVDVMVATADYHRTVQELRSEKDLAFDWDDGKLARFRILGLGGVPLDIIDAVTFSGRGSGESSFGTSSKTRPSTPTASATPLPSWSGTRGSSRNGGERTRRRS